MAYSKINGLYLPTTTSKVARIGCLSIWAHNGIVCLSNELPDGGEDFKQLSPDEARLRCSMLGEEIQELRRVEKPDYHRIKLQEQFVIAFDEVIKRAIEQGTPTDKDAQKDRLRRRKVTVSVPTKAELKEIDQQNKKAT